MNEENEGDDRMIGYRLGLQMDQQIALGLMKLLQH